MKTETVEKVQENHKVCAKCILCHKKRTQTALMNMCVCSYKQLPMCTDKTKQARKTG